MDLDLTDEQRLIQETGRSFVDERVLPNAVETGIALRRVRARARDVRPADRPVPVRAGHDREDGARLRDVEAARDAGGMDEERGQAELARDGARKVARDGVRLRGGP